jgi:hypothetical protein
MRAQCKGFKHAVQGGGEEGTPVPPPAGVLAWLDAAGVRLNGDHKRMLKDLPPALQVLWPPACMQDCCCTVAAHIISDTREGDASFISCRSGQPLGSLSTLL